MAKKKSSGPSISLDSFLDVLTCLQGVLMLVIISTGIDAAQTKVLIPTPIERHSDRIPVYVECRDNLIYPIDVETLWRDAKAKMGEIARQAKGDQIKMMQAISSDEFKVTNEYYEVDLSYALVGQFAIRPKTSGSTPGFVLEERSTFSTDNFMTRLLNGMDKDKQKIMMIVRDDSYDVFKVAQRLSFLKKIEVAVEVFESREPIRFNQMVRGSKI